MKTFIDRMTYGIILMTLTGFGIFFIGAIPIVTMFGGFSGKSNNIGDGLASVGYTFIVGIILYVVLFSYLIHMWLY